MEDLPADTLQAMLAHVSLLDRARLALACCGPNSSADAKQGARDACSGRAICDALNEVDTRRRRYCVNVVRSEVPPPSCVLQRFRSLEHLDLGASAGDEALEVLGQKSDHMPNLSTLLCRFSDVTDAGIEKLGCPSLRELDVTFCRRVTYGGTLRLRDRLPGLRLVRRLPAHLVGAVRTPFGEDGEETEIHTYYADGSFKFSRERESMGFVMSLEPWNGCINSKLQYAKLGPLAPGWPDWTGLCYRPSVSIKEVLPLRSDQRSILVAQCLSGLRPPTFGVPFSIDGSDIPLESSIYLCGTHDGRWERLAGSPDRADAVERGARLLVSHMRVDDAAEETTPPELIAKLRDFLQESERLMRDDPAGDAHYEAHLHTLLSK